MTTDDTSPGGATGSDEEVQALVNDAEVQASASPPTFLTSMTRGEEGWPPPTEELLRAMGPEGTRDPHYVAIRQRADDCMASQAMLAYHQTTLAKIQATVDSGQRAPDELSKKAGWGWGGWPGGLAFFRYGDCGIEIIQGRRPPPGVTSSGPSLRDAIAARVAREKAKADALQAAEAEEEAADPHADLPI